MEIAGGVYDLTAPMRGYLKGGYVHAFLVDTGPDLMLIDTLFDADAKVILDELERIGKRPTDIKHILMTHGHRAHMGGIAMMKRLSGARVYAHEWEADIIAGERPMQLIGFWPSRPLASWPILFFGILAGPLGKHKPCPVDELIGEGAKVGPLTVLHTPGHTPGHLTFYWPERRALFTGDSFVTWPVVSPGWENTMLNKRETWESLRRMAELDVEVVGVGHGRPLTKNGAEVVRELAARGSV